jgi:prophage antirepressor-like protein
MSNLIPFQYEGRPVRVVEIDGEPWFNASEICEILGFANPWDAVQRHVDADDLGKYEVVDSKGRKQQANHVNESGLYALIFGSTKEEAKRFKRWVTHEVLPSIRRSGAYVAPSAKTIEATKLFKPMFQIARMIGCDKQAAAISANQAVQAVSGTNLLALMGQTHIEASNQDAMFFTPSELGKRIEVSGRGMNLLLAEAGLQMKQGEVWVPTDAGKDFSRIFDTGKRHSTGTPVQQVKWAENVLALVQKAA